MGSNGMQQKATGLKPVQLRVIGLLAAGRTVTEAAKKAGVDRTTIYRWQEHAAFIEHLNRLKSEQFNQLRGELRSLASLAVDTLRDLLTNAETDDAIRLRAAHLVVQATGVDGKSTQPVSGPNGGPLQFTGKVEFVDIIDGDEV